MRKTNAVKSVSGTPMSGLDSGRTSVGWMGFEANGLGLRCLGIDVVQGDHEAELVSNLASVDSGFFPAILAASGKRMSGVDGTMLCPGRWPRTTRRQPRPGRPLEKDTPLMQ